MLHSCKFCRRLLFGLKELWYNTEKFKEREEWICLVPEVPADAVPAVSEEVITAPEADIPAVPWAVCPRVPWVAAEWVITALWAAVSAVTEPRPLHPPWAADTTDPTAAAAAAAVP